MRNIFILAVACSLVLIAPAMRAGAQQENKTETKVEMTEEKIPYEVQYIFNRDLRAGAVKKVTNGEFGKKITRIIRTYTDGELVDETTETETIDPKNAIFHMGKSNQYASRSGYTRDRVVVMHSTAYLPTDGSGHGRTASGLKAKYGVVAVDPRVIPLGSTVFVEGYGFAVAADTGGAIKGNIIDVCVHNRSEAMQWGRRKVTVHIFKDRDDRIKRRR